MQNWGLSTLWSSPKGELFLFPADSCPNERDKCALVFLHKKLRNCEALYVVFTLLTNVLE